MSGGPRPEPNSLYDNRSEMTKKSGAPYLFKPMHQVDSTLRKPTAYVQHVSH